MNRDSVLEFLLKVLGPIAIAPQLIKEILDLISGTGIEAKFFAVLIARLDTLKSNGASAVKYKEFEPVKNGSGLFSMHVTGKGFNIRVLYSFLPSRQPALLLAFYEREGKKKTDYSGYIAPANSRMELLRKEFEQ